MRQSRVENASDDSGFGLFRVADLAGLVNLFPGEAEVGDGRFNVPIRNLEIASATVPSNFPPLLRRVVLVGEVRSRVGAACTTN